MATVVIIQQETLKLCPCCEATYIPKIEVVCKPCEEFLERAEQETLMRAFERDRDTDTGVDDYGDV